MRRTFVAFAALVVVWLPTPAAAQPWPVKPIRFIVTVTPGAGGDILARAVGEKVSLALGQPIVVDNKPGAGGNIGAEFVAKSAPDGYSMLMTNAALPIFPAMFSKLSYDVESDFEHVAAFGTSQFVLVCSPSLPVHNIPDLISLARARAGKLSFASGGVGSPLHLGMELFKSMTGTDLVHIPYKATPPALIDIAAGRVDMIFTTYSSAKAFIESGKIRLLAAGGSARMQSMPDLPTISEAGVPGFGVDGWYGIAFPARTPESAVNRMAQEVQAALRQKELAANLATLGFDITFEGPKEIRQRIHRETAQWARLIKEAGIKPE